MPTAKQTPAEVEAPLVQMRHERETKDTTLTIGETVYEVKAGRVAVRHEHLDAARQAGYQVR
jgi:hypothetical protein